MRLKYTGGAVGTMLRTARRARYRVSRKEFPLWEGIAAFITVINCGMIFFFISFISVHARCKYAAKAV